MKDKVIGAFEERFGAPPRFVVRAPGRVNLIGEHTDYNDGFVFPMAIERAVWIAFSPSSDRAVQLKSLLYGEELEFDAAAPVKGGPSWGEYVKGVAWAMRDAGLAPGGWQGVAAGDVPLGSGLSSSAALEVAAALAFCAEGGGAMKPAEAARICQRAENEWVGVQCGIMDQLISAAAREGSALLIDCRSLQFDALPLPGGTTVVILDTGTRRKLDGSAYNERRAQCEAGAKVFGLESLRDLPLSEFEARSGSMDETVRKRCRHVLNENRRTLAAAQALRAGDAAKFGALMNESHASLRDDYEVSSPALDAMAEAAQGASGCLGARMTGAGFGGCAVALVESGALEEFMAAVKAQYERATDNEAALYPTPAAAGASIE